MSTPQTLVQQAAPHHYNLDYRQRPVLNVNDRHLPPPRPSSSVSNGYYHPPSNPPSAPRPASNLSGRQFPQPQHQPQRADTSHSGGGGSSSSSGLSHHQNQQQQIPPQLQQQRLQPSSRDSAVYSYGSTTNGPTQQPTTPHEHQQAPYGDLRRTSSRASQHHRQPPMPPVAHAVTTPAITYRSPHASVTSAQHQPRLANDLSASATSRYTQAGAEQENKRRNRSPVDWVAFFNGKVPDEIITIHDDDSPHPEVHALPPPTPNTTTTTTTNTSATALHVDKRRRINADASASTTTHHNSRRVSGSYSNAETTSADSLNNTTAPTSLGSVGSTGSRLDGPQVGQKRKRSYVRTEPDIVSFHEQPQTRPRGYLSTYGNYMPGISSFRKQKDVHVRHITERHKAGEKVDDDDGHYIVHEGSNIGERYKLQNLLGQGTFGKVVRAQDLRTRKEVAVKIIRAVPKYRDASRIELRVLQTLRVADEQNRNRCIQLYDCFDWRGHICIVTPLLGYSVFDFLKQGGFVPFPGSQIQAFAWQLLGSIAFLHDTNLIHTDLKPENILLLNHAYQTFTYNRNIPSASTLTARTAKFRRVLLNPGINLIDFGSATFDDEYHSSVVSTRHYRAPEIILGIGWSFPIDLWSLGCILVECWTGDALFQTHDCAEHLAMMEMVTGSPIDRTLVREVARTSKRSDRNSATKFFKNGHLAYPQADTPRQSRKFVKAMKRLDEIIPPTNHFNKLFLDLLRKIFIYDPKKRITAREALKHPWFDEIVEDDGTEATKIREERERQQREDNGAELNKRRL